MKKKRLTDDEIDALFKKTTSGRVSFKGFMKPTTIAEEYQRYLDALISDNPILGADGAELLLKVCRTFFLSGVLHGHQNDFRPSHPP